VLAADDVRSTPEIVVQDLCEEHDGATVAPLSAISPEVIGRAPATGTAG
jgi:hypothetical protein